MAAAAGRRRPARVHRPARGIRSRAHRRRAIRGAGARRARRLLRGFDADGGARRSSSRPAMAPPMRGTRTAGAPASTSRARSTARRGRASGRPSASAACASGLHALFLARRAIEAGAREAVVLAADIATRPGHDSFETLRILGEADEPAPWQPRRAGFTLGEAAVALRLAPGNGDAGALLGGPLLGTISKAMTASRACSPRCRRPRRRWCSRRARAPPPRTAPSWTRSARASTPTFPSRAPCTTSGTRWARPGCCPSRSPPLASRAAIPRALAMPDARAADGRPLVTGAVAAARSAVVCRALGGACAALTMDGARRCGRFRSRGDARRPRRRCAIRCCASSCTRPRPPPRCTAVAAAGAARGAARAAVRRDDGW